MNDALAIYAVVVTVLLLIALLYGWTRSRELEQASRQLDHMDADARAYDQDRRRLIEDRSRLTQERDAARAEVARRTPVKGDRGRFVPRT